MSSRNGLSQYLYYKTTEIKKTTSYISSIGNALLKLFYLAGMGGQDKKNNENYFGFKITIVARNMPLCTKQSALGLRETAMAVLCPY